jgi:hypothetical protein
MINKTKDQIRMELYKEVYLQYSLKIQTYTGNIAKQEAEKAVMAFDEQFNKYD